MQVLDVISKYDGSSSNEIVGTGGLGTGGTGTNISTQAITLPTGALAVKAEFLGSTSVSETPWVAGDPGPEYLDVELYRIVAGVETLLHTRRVMTRINAINENNDAVHQDLDPNPFLMFVDELPTGTSGSVSYRIRGKTDQKDGTLKIARRQLVLTVLG